MSELPEKTDLAKSIEGVNQKLPVQGEKNTVESWLNSVNYEVDPDYVPSVFALKFILFIKSVEGGNTENKSPVMHYHMIDNFIGGTDNDVANLCHRGSAKTTLKEFLILYCGVFNELPGLGDIPYGLYVSDSIDNGVKKMRNRLELRCQNSEFLRKYIPKTRFTDVRWEFWNREGKSTVFTGHGAQSGVRGTVENLSRPVLALLDDLISDTDAKSPTVIGNIEDTIYNALEHALHPSRRKVIWSGTPFNARDPLYIAVESGAYIVNVYPVCEKFPCTKEEFRGSWPDRFTYEVVMKRYLKAVKVGKVAGFYQELMLRIMSEEDRLVEDGDLVWYPRAAVLRNRDRYNFYITTDLATSDGIKSDFSVICVWAYTNKSDWLLVDGMCKKQLMDKNVDEVFRFCAMYHPLSVGIEINGQQKGFIAWLKTEMIHRNIFFNLAKQGTIEGIRRVANKLDSFKLFLPVIKAKKLWLPTDLKDSALLVELLEEIRFACNNGLRSKHDDALDCLSMLPELQAYTPGEDVVASYTENEDGSFGQFEGHQEEEYGNSTVF
jgi:hypothetical protein